MLAVSYQMLHEERPHHIILDPEGEHCQGCGASLKPGPEHCDYCNRPAVSDPMGEYTGSSHARR